MLEIAAAVSVCNCLRGCRGAPNPCMVLRSQRRLTFCSNSRGSLAPRFVGKPIPWPVGLLSKDKCRVVRLRKCLVVQCELVRPKAALSAGADIVALVQVRPVL